MNRQNFTHIIPHWQTHIQCKCLTHREIVCQPAQKGKIHIPVNPFWTYTQNDQTTSHSTPLHMGCCTMSTFLLNIKGNCKAVTMHTETRTSPSGGVCLLWCTSWTALTILSAATSSISTTTTKGLSHLPGSPCLLNPLYKRQVWTWQLQPDTESPGKCRSESSLTQSWQEIMGRSKQWKK